MRQKSSRGIWSSLHASSQRSPHPRSSQTSEHRRALRPRLGRADDHHVCAERDQHLRKPRERHRADLGARSSPAHAPSESRPSGPFSLSPPAATARPRLRKTRWRRRRAPRLEIDGFESGRSPRTRRRSSPGRPSPSTSRATRARCCRDRRSGARCDRRACGENYLGRRGDRR